MLLKHDRPRLDTWIRRRVSTYQNRPDEGPAQHLDPVTRAVLDNAHLLPRRCVDPQPRHCRPLLCRPARVTLLPRHSHHPWFMAQGPRAH